MINLFENLDIASTDLLRSELFAKMDIPSVVIHDNGFMPDEVDSPAKFYCEFDDSHRPLYFDQAPIPKFWRIESTNVQAQVYDLDQKRAEIIFNSNDNSRLIMEIHWLDRHGKISWVEHYNKFGQLFAKTFYDNGKAVLRKYFNKTGQTVMEYNLIAGDIFLDNNGMHRHFANIDDFMVFFLQERNYNLDHIIYNTLNKSLSISLKLPLGKGDVMVWHEQTGDALPGNMNFLMTHKTRTKYIVFQNYREWEKCQSIIPKDTGNVKFSFLGVTYPHPRSNKLRPDALILTNSDQIEHLKEVVESLPMVRFNIAAITAMSDKLLAFKKYDNVELYPNVARTRVADLFKNCDLYFDINHGNEILNGVRVAFEQNMLILGFENTIHNSKYMNNENIFSPDNVLGMKERVNKALKDINEMRRLIDIQRKMAGDVQTEDFKRDLMRLIND